MAKKKELPKKLFVYREWDGDELYFMTYETERECADLNEDRLIGVYELIGVGKVDVTVSQIKLK